MSLIAPTINTGVPDAKWRETISREVNQLWRPLFVKPTTTYTIKIVDRFVLADATAAPFTTTLPPANGNPNLLITVKRINSAANNVTIAAAGSEKIDNSATLVLNTTYQAARLISDGSNWWTV